MKQFYTLLLLCVMSATLSAQGLVLNEALFDPAPTTTPAGTQNGDANEDGTRDASDDEFMEFINNSSSSLDISGYKIYDSANFGQTPDNPRHVVPAGTIIPAGEMYVVFGGGDVTAIDNLTGVTAHTSSSGSLSMTNSGETMTVTDFDDNVLISLTPGDLLLNASLDHSLARTPDVTGPFRHHFYIDATRHSPGRMNGSPSFPTSFELVLNELHADPDFGNPEGDANGDGVRDASDDEFIEFFNDSGAEVDISGYKLYDYRGFEESTPNHVFPAGTIISANGVLVLFGGGTPNTAPDYFGDAIVQTASNASSGLSLTNGGDNIFITDDFDNVVMAFDSSELDVDWGDNQSVTRSPDVSGDFVLHTSTSSGSLYSPGFKTDGTVLSQESFEKLGLNVYPNPVTKGIINIQSSYGGEKNVELYDLTGRQVLNRVIESDVINVSALRSGLYLLKVTTKRGSATSKLLIE